MRDAVDVLGGHGASATRRTTRATPVVGSRQDVFHIHQRMAGRQGLGCKRIQAGAADLSRTERFNQRRFNSRRPISCLVWDVNGTCNDT